MTHGSLFSGIGGFDYASHVIGWRNLFQCEIDFFCRQVLSYYWPNSIIYEDIKQTDFSIWRGKINVLSGGFPCQPFSNAGKRKGVDDNRYLWPEMLRAIREIGPKWVVAENVAGIMSQENGLVFEKVCSDLENEGYQVQTFTLPACAVNAPHRRDRVWFLCRINTNSLRNGLNPDQQHEKGRKSFKDGISQYDNKQFHFNGFNTNPCCERLERRQGNPKGEKWKCYDKKQPSGYGEFDKWEGFPNESPICSGNDGISNRLDGITFSKWRKESIKGYGNAIIPQIAIKIFQAIQNIESDEQ